MTRFAWTQDAQNSCQDGTEQKVRRQKPVMRLASHESSRGVAINLDAGRARNAPGDLITAGATPQGSLFHPSTLSRFRDPQVVRLTAQCRPMPPKMYARSATWAYPIRRNIEENSSMETKFFSESGM
jgi:hypothetical protein